MDANSTVPPIPPNVAAKTGPRLLGFMFHWGLFGALCVQVYIYSLAFQRDPKRNKFLVYSVFVLELVQTVFFTQSAFYIFGEGYGNFEYFEQIRFTWFTAPLLTGIVAFIAQVFYAYRIRILSGSYLVASITTCLAIVQLGGAIGTAVVQKHTVLITNLLGHNYSISAGIWNGASALCDVIIAFFMTYYLSRRGAGVMESTNIILKRLTALVIETGTITALLAIVNLVLSVLPGRPSYFLASSITLGKVYSNSMMAVLNSRMRLGDEGHTVSWSLPKDGANNSVGRYGSSAPMHGGTDAYELGEGIKITREEVVFPSASELSKEHPSRKAYLV